MDRRILVLLVVPLLLFAPVSAWGINWHHCGGAYIPKGHTLSPGECVSIDGPDIGEVAIYGTDTTMGANGPIPSYYHDTGIHVMCPVVGDCGYNATLPISPYTYYAIGSIHANFAEKDQYGVNTDPLLLSDFTCAPTNGTAPLSVWCSHTDMNNLSTYNWSISPSGGTAIIAPVDAATVNMMFYVTGNFTITHGAATTTVSNITTKSDYIWVINSSSMITTPFTAIDLAFGNPIQGAAISLQDIQNNSWSNTSSTGPDGKWSITTLGSHRLNGYGTSLGYEDADLLDVDATAFGHYLYMVPEGYTNVSEGNVTAFIHVVDYDNFNISVPFATVTALWKSQSASTTASAAGIARFVLPNSTNVVFQGSKVGYSSNSISLNTGIPSGDGAAVTGTIYLSKHAVTYNPTPSVTSTQTPIKTLLPNCDSEDDYSPECQKSINDFNMGWMVRNAWGLIGICFLFTILYIMGWKP